MKNILTITTILLLYSCTKENTSKSIDNESYLGVYDTNTNNFVSVSKNGNYIKINWNWEEGYVRNDRIWDSAVVNADNTFVINEYVGSKFPLTIPNNAHSIGTGYFSENIIYFKIKTDNETITFNGIKRP